MSININESIYQFINRMAEQHPGLPYRFQDATVAGSVEARYFLWEEGLSVGEKELLAMGLMEKVAECVEQADTDSELRTILEEKPVFLYLANLTNRIKLLISEKLIDKDRLYSFAIRLATESEFEDEVKLGMLVLGFFENDLVRKIIKMLGYHSELTIYAVEASKNFHDYNEFLYDLAQNTCGYGKLAALINFEPIFLLQQKWILEYGVINEALPNMSAIMCLEKVDMRRFYQRLEITEDVFSKLSYLVAYAAETNDIKVFSQSLALVEKYIGAANNYAKYFIDLAAIIAIKKSMAPYWYHSGEDIKKENGWTSNKEHVIRNKCSELLKQAKWRQCLIQELDMPCHQTSLIILTMEEIGLVPSFETLLPLLQRDFFDMNVLKFVLVDHSEHYLHDIFNYLSKVLPKEVFCDDPLEISKDSISSEYKPDIWLVFLLKALRKERQNEEALFIRCLTSRFPDVRIEAIHALRVFKSNWSALVFPALEQACEIEPVNNIKKRFLRLMGKNDGGQKKEQRYIDVTEMKVAPSLWDASLCTTKIAGTYYRDLMVMEGRIENGDILYLIREPDNPYDSNAIIVTAEDGYVLGYVPKADNLTPASMMDAGEKLYAIFRSENLEKGKPDIQIMISKRPEKAGTLVQFPFSKVGKIGKYPKGE